MAVEFRTDNTTVSGAVQGDVFSIAGGGAASVTATPSSAAAGTSVAANAGLAIRLTYTPPDAAFQSGITRLMILQDLANQDDGVSYIPLADSPIAQQTIAAESEMRLLGRGSRLVGMFHRSLALSPWPTAADFYPRYDIELSRAVNTPSTPSAAAAAGSPALPRESGDPMRILVGPRRAVTSLAVAAQMAPDGASRGF